MVSGAASNPDMTSCPSCGAIIVHADGGGGTIPYCAHCGWNSEAAAILLRRGAKTYLSTAVGLLLVVLVAAWMKPAMRPAAIGIAVAAVGYPLLQAASRWWRLRRISDPLHFSHERMDQSASALSSVTNAGANWDGYYRARTFARLTTVGLPVILVLFASTPVERFAWLANLSNTEMVVVLLLVIGAATVLVSVPFLRWAGWRCPRCHRQYVQPPTHARIVVFAAALWRLAFDSDCATCHLPCGEQ
jgi:hypothetical protein